MQEKLDKLRASIEEANKHEEKLKKGSILFTEEEYQRLREIMRYIEICNNHSVQIRESMLADLATL